MDALIFDMDGVIVDSEPIWIASKQKTLQELGVKVADSYHYQLFGTTLEHMWTRMKKDFNLPLSVDQCIAKGEKIRGEMLRTEPTKAIPGAVPLIKRLNQAGVPLAIASSSSVEDIEKAVTSLKLQPYFQALVSGETCERSKPFPDVFLKAAQALAIEPDKCLVIEDSVSGVKAAKAAGMVCLGFENPTFPKQDLRQADGLIQDFSTVTLESCHSYFYS